MLNGFIALHRQMKQWTWYTDGPTKDVFLHLLLSANWEDRSVRGHDVPRGSCAIAIRILASETGLSVQRVRTAIKRLISTREITQQTTKDFSIFSITNWDKFQDVNTQFNIASTRNQHATNTQSTQSKQINKETREQENKTNGVRKRTAYPVEFEEKFWKPWKAVKGGGAKDPAAKAWKRLHIEDRTEAERIAPRYFTDWRKQNPDISPLHAATYLNQKRWIDFEATPINGAAGIDEDQLERMKAEALAKRQQREQARSEQANA